MIYKNSIRQTHPKEENCFANTPDSGVSKTNWKNNQVQIGG
jgi:hypothetical protein